MEKCEGRECDGVRQRHKGERWGKYFGGIPREKMRNKRRADEDE